MIRPPTRALRLLMLAAAGSTLGAAAATAQSLSVNLGEGGTFSCSRSSRWHPRSW